MAYSLSLDDLAASVKRVAGDQLGAAADGLEDPEDPVEAVHDARKRLKKTRSLLRLARPAMRADAFRAYNHELRDQGRALSGARDADVMVETVDALAEHNTRRVKRAHFMAVRARFVADAAGELPEHRVPELADGADRWPLGGISSETLAEALTTTYKRGRKAASKPPTTENLHEWRKRAKDLWYHARLLEEAWPRVFKAQAKEAHALADLLGDDHDLAMLAAQLDAGNAAHVALDEATLCELITRDRAGLQARAWGIGHRLYGEPAKAYRRRLTGYLRSLEREVRAGTAA
jgi:CHAD domain-containing protein